MSQVRSCDGGCGTTDQYGALTRLTRVSVTTGIEKATMSRDTWEADLCPLRGYFGHRPESDPGEIPAFLRGAA
jgi:hypothetical protein